MVAGTRNPQTQLTVPRAVESASQLRQAGGMRTQEPPTYTGNLRNRFRPLAKARVSGVLVALDYFAQLAQRNRYHYTDQEVQVLERAILDKVAEVFEQFRLGKGPSWANHPGGMGGTWAGRFSMVRGLSACSADPFRMINVVIMHDPRTC